ncbi:MAG: exonuclease subunit SbcD [Deltaproteobacteria bacterium]|nr:exonuclease subunit SbcD [Deltaproteobacteria bacterium]
MRILHTSDWHLGVTFCDRSRADAQRHFLDWLLATVEARAIDAVVIAGDVFDTANPTAEALALYYGFLADLARLDARTSTGGRRTAIIVGGNHDSATRLDAPREALRALDVHVVGGHDPSRLGRDDADPCGVLVPLRDARGEVRLVVAAVPYLNDWRIGVRGFDVDAAQQLTSMHEAFGRVYAELAAKSEALFPGVARMATGHLTCLAERGARTTEADAVPLEINRVGTLGSMAPSIFGESYRYVALGHIHRGFPVDSAGRIRYSGTPVQVSATENADDRKVLVVSFDGDATHVEALFVPVRRRLVRLSGSADAILDALAELRVPEGELPPYVTVDLELPAPEPLAEERLLARVTTTLRGKVEIVKVRGLLLRSGDSPTAEARRALLVELTPEAVLRHAWKSKFGANAVPPDAVLERFRLLVSEGPLAEREVTS